MLHQLCDYSVLLSVNLMSISVVLHLAAKPFAEVSLASSQSALLKFSSALAQSLQFCDELYLDVSN